MTITFKGIPGHAQPRFALPDLAAKLDPHTEVDGICRLPVDAVPQVVGNIYAHLASLGIPLDTKVIVNQHQEPGFSFQGGSYGRAWFTSSYDFIAPLGGAEGWYLNVATWLPIALPTPRVLVHWNRAERRIGRPYGLPVTTWWRAG